MVRDRDGMRRGGPAVFCRGVTPNSCVRNGPGTVGCRWSRAACRWRPATWSAATPTAWSWCRGRCLARSAAAGGVAEAERAAEAAVKDGETARPELSSSSPRVGRGWFRPGAIAGGSDGATRTAAARRHAAPCGLGRIGADRRRSGAGAVAAGVPGSTAACARVCDARADHRRVSRSPPASAAAIGRKLAAMLGGEPTPESLLTLDDAALRAAGFSRPKAAYARGLAQALVTPRRARPVRSPRSGRGGRLVADLTRPQGLWGRWSAEIYLLFAHGRADVVSRLMIWLCRSPTSVSSAWTRFCSDRQGAARAGGAMAAVSRCRRRVPVALSTAPPRWMGSP